ncbi:MAG: DNA topoisomerase VI subunit B [Candidatus Micrarchaeota archaeon]|nr:DNA topoisomerase VI subunit B [Candidatus Micrarchaeota archaeon]
MGVTKAHELAKKHREISVAEFFEKNRHLLGFDNPSKALLTVVKEAVDNSLDACEEARILPEITVKIKQMEEDRFRVSVEDNGPGIVKEQIPKIFGKLLYGSKFGAGKQSRGQQGIGISAAVLYAQLTTGKPAVVYSRTAPDRPVRVFHIRIDTMRNEPVIVKEESKDTGIKNHGVRIELEIEGRYAKRHQSVDEYLKQTFVVNPYATITYVSPDGRKTVYKRVSNELPKLPKEIKPHPYGVEVGVLERMLKLTKARNLVSFLTGEFSRVGKNTAEEMCRLAGLKPSSRPQDLNHEEVQKLWRAMQKVKLMKPPLDCLSPISAELLERGLKNEFNPEFVASVSRPPAVYRGNPFQIECAIAYGGDIKSDEAIVLRFANKVPLLYQASACAITKAVQQIRWNNYGLGQHGNQIVGPVVIAVHMASVWIPFTSESKEAIASYPEIIKEIKLALQECGRKLGSYIRGKRRLLEKERKMSLFNAYIPELAEALEYLTGTRKEEIERMLKEFIGGEDEKNDKETGGDGKENTG